MEASGSGDHDSITVWHDDGRQSSIIGFEDDGTFDVTIETDKREVRVDLTSSMPSLSARVLWAALDVLTEGQFPRLWGATVAGPFQGLGQGVHWTPTPKRLWRSFVSWMRRNAVTQHKRTCRSRDCAAAIEITRKKSKK